MQQSCTHRPGSGFFPVNEDVKVEKEEMEEEEEREEVEEEEVVEKEEITTTMQSSKAMQQICTRGQADCFFPGGREENIGGRGGDGGGGGGGGGGEQLPVIALSSSCSSPWLLVSAVSCAVSAVSLCLLFPVRVGHTSSHLKSSRHSTEMMESVHVESDGLGRLLPLLQRSCR